MRILEHHPERPSKICLLYLIHVYPVISYLTVLYVIKPVYEVRDSGLPCTRRAHKGYLLPGLCKKLYVMEHHLIISISKIHVMHLNISLKQGIIRGTGCLMVVLPCPGMGMVFCGTDGAILTDPCICERHIPVVLFRLLVKHIKYPLRPGKGHEYGVKLRGYLIYRHIEALIKGKEACKLPYCKGRLSMKRQRTSYRRAQHVADVTQLRINGT